MSITEETTLEETPERRSIDTDANTLVETKERRSRDSEEINLGETSEIAPAEKRKEDTGVTTPAETLEKRSKDTDATTQAERNNGTTISHIWMSEAWARIGTLAANSLTPNTSTITRHNQDTAVSLIALRISYISHPRMSTNRCFWVHQTSTTTFSRVLARNKASFTSLTTRSARKTIITHRLLSLEKRATL